MSPRFRSPHLHRAGLFGLALLAYFVLDRWIDLPPVGLVFHSETIRAVPRGDAVEFVCQFEFHAAHPRQAVYRLFFPTHQERAQAPPRAIDITVDGRSVEPEWRANGFGYRMPVTPGQVSRKTVRYTIAAPARKAVYVTRTANQWPRPPETARFILSPGMRSNYHRSGELEIEFKSFSPKDNWEVAWP